MRILEFIKDKCNVCLYSGGEGGSDVGALIGAVSGENNLKSLLALNEMLFLLQVSLQHFSDRVD